MANLTVWSPLQDPENKIHIGGMLTPGICDISGPSDPREWEERAGYGLSGATIVFKGRKLSHFSIKLRLYTVQDWQDWYEFLPKISVIPVGKNARGFDIEAKLTEMVGIKAICFEDIVAPDQTGDGEWTAELKCIEYRKPTFTLAKADGAQATEVDANDEKINANNLTIQKQLQRLAKPNNKTGTGG
jgi:hypothetical protein